MRMIGVVVEVERGRKIVWQLKRWRVLLPIRLILELRDRDGGVTLRHTIRAGFGGSGQVLDPLFQVYFSPIFASDMNEHVHTEFPKLRDLLAGEHPDDPEAPVTTG